MNNKITVRRDLSKFWGNLQIKTKIEMQGIQGSYFFKFQNFHNARIQISNAFVIDDRWKLMVDKWFAQICWIKDLQFRVFCFPWKTFDFYVCACVLRNPRSNKMVHLRHLLKIFWPTPAPLTHLILCLSWFLASDTSFSSIRSKFCCMMEEVFSILQYLQKHCVYRNFVHTGSSVANSCLCAEHNLDRSPLFYDKPKTRKTF